MIQNVTKRFFVSFVCARSLTCIAEIGLTLFLLCLTCKMLKIIVNTIDTTLMTTAHAEVIAVNKSLFMFDGSIQHIILFPFRQHSFFDASHIN